ncbi:tetratricopeptide repeat protein, partial [Myxococcota bacterium]|nr:tetratricopeptide repeat protein [Myxococcota bacterium]
QMLGKVKEGTALLLKAVATNSTLAFAYFEPGRKIGIAKYYQRLGQWQKSLDAFQAFLKHRPSAIKKDTDYIVLFRIGEAQLKLNKPTLALDSCDKALKLKTQYPSALWCKAESLRLLDRHTEALPYFRRVSRYGGNKPRIFLGMAVSMFYSGSGLASIAYVKRYLGLRPTDPYGHTLLGDLLFATGRKTDSIRSFQRAIKLDPQDTKVYIKLAINFISIRQYAKAVELLEPAVKRWPKNHLLLVPLSFAYLKLKNSDKAYNAIAALDPGKLTPKLLTIYGNAAMENGKLDQARDILTKALKLRPDHRPTKDITIRTYFKLGYRDLVKGSFDQSAKSLKSALDLDPNNTNVIQNLSLLYLMKGDFKSASDLLERGLKLQANNYYFIRLKGRMLLEKKEYKAAITWLETARERATKRSSDVLARVQLDLSLAYLNTGDTEKAVDLMKEAQSNSLTIPKLARMIEANLVRGYLSRAATRLTAGKGKEALQDLKAMSDYEVPLTVSESRQRDFLKGMAYIELGNFGESGKYMNRVGKTADMATLFKAPYDKFGPTLLKAYIAYRQMRLGEARALFRRIVDKLPAGLKGQVYAFLVSCDAVEGSNLLKRGKAKGALALLTKVPDGARTIGVKMNLALAYYKTGSTGKAVELWKNIGTAQANCNLGAHYHNSGDSQSSYLYLKKCAAAGLGGASVKRLISVKEKIFGYK